MKNRKISFAYILIAIMAVIFTWIVHELAHWFISESFGYDTILKINGTSLVKDENPPAWQTALISASGPIITIIQAMLAFIFLYSGSWKKYLYPFLFTAFYMRLLATFMTFITVNDEGRISEYLGIGTFTLPIMVCGLLFFMVYTVSGKHNLSWRFQFATTIAVMLASSILILSDQFFGIRLL